MPKCPLVIHGRVHREQVDVLVPSRRASLQFAPASYRGLRAFLHLGVQHIRVTCLDSNLRPLVSCSLHAFVPCVDSHARLHTFVERRVDCIQVFLRLGPPDSGADLPHILPIEWPSYLPLSDPTSRLPQALPRALGATDAEVVCRPSCWFRPCAARVQAKQLRVQGRGASFAAASRGLDGDHSDMPCTASCHAAMPRSDSALLSVHYYHTNLLSAQAAHCPHQSVPYAATFPWNACRFSACPGSVIYF